MEEKDIELPEMYGTLCYQMMLAANIKFGYRTVWLPDESGTPTLQWVGIPIPGATPEEIEAEEKGLKAIVALQAMVHIEEHPEKARHEWRMMNQGDKNQTMLAYRACFGGEPLAQAHVH